MGGTGTGMPSHFGSAGVYIPQNTGTTSHFRSRVFWPLLQKIAQNQIFVYGFQTFKAILICAPFTQSCTSDNYRGLKPYCCCYSRPNDKQQCSATAKTRKRELSEISVAIPSWRKLEFFTLDSCKIDCRTAPSLTTCTLTLHGSDRKSPVQGTTPTPKQKGQTRHRK